jgi:hypothetical protein
MVVTTVCFVDKRGAVDEVWSRFLPAHLNRHPSTISTALPFFAMMPVPMSYLWTAISKAMLLMAQL